jgi:hypothetical protein
MKIQAIGQWGLGDIGSCDRRRGAGRMRIGRVIGVAGALCISAASEACRPPSTVSSASTALASASPHKPAYVETLRELKRARSASALVFVLGYNETGDGGGGAFYWDKASALPDDGGLTIAPERGGEGILGRWRRVLDASGSLQVQWFGARCDGRTPDDSAFQNAIAAANGRGGTILLPPGKTCLISQLNFGQATPTASTPLAQAAVGITVRGAGSAWPGAVNPSTIYINPQSPTTRDCTALANNTGAVAGNGGIALGPNVSVVAFESLVVMAGPNLGNCIVNASHTGDSEPGGDPIRIRFSNVAFLGNGSNTAVGVYLSNTGYMTFEECLFYRSRTGILGNLSGSNYNTRIVHCMFYPLNQRALSTTPAVLFGDTEALDLSDNAFEYGLSGVSLRGLRGGVVRSNWFNAEGVDPRESRAEWMRVQCQGCVVEGNRIIGGGARNGSGVDGIIVSAQGALVAGNNFQGALLGTPLTIEGTGISVLNNFFEGGTSPSQSDIVVSGGDHIVAGNVHFGSNGHSITFLSRSRGLYGDAASADRTLGKVDDSSAPSDAESSGWKTLSTADASLSTALQKPLKTATDGHSRPVLPAGSPAR